MTDNKAPEESPNFLPTPGRGEGVRRLNKIPLIVIAGVIMLAVIAVTYTAFQRGDAATSTAAKSAVDIGNVSAAAEPPVKPEDAPGPPKAPAEPDQAVDMFANASSVPTDQVVPAIQPNAGGAAGQAAPSATAPQAPMLTPAQEERRQRAQRIRDAKTAAYEAGLSAESGVQSFGRTSATAAPTPASMQAADPAAAMAMAAMGAGDAGGSGARRQSRQGEGSEDPNQQDHKRAFLSDSPEAEVYLKHTRQAAVAPTEVKAGTVIPGVMIGGINSDLPGQIVGQVRQNVYDTATGRYLLIPAGARLVGTYDSTVTNGQRRVLVGWNRIVYPDGSSVSLDVMPGADRGGYAGFKDKANSHYGRLFANALLLSGFSAGVQLSQPQSTGQNYSAREVASAELGRQLGQLGIEVARKGMDVQPTITIRPGYLFNIMVTKDIILPRWVGRR